MDDKMRVGILTIHCNYNFGSLLQSYALQYYIESLGYDVEIINFRPEYITTKKPKLFLNILHPLPFVQRVIKYSHLKKNYQIFKEAERVLHLTDEVKGRSDLESACKCLDVIVIGSDQIWSSRITKGDRIWFGEFAKGSVRKIAYAASAGDVCFSEEVKNYFPILFENFKKVSVREEKLAEYIFNNYGLRVPCVLDPTLMIPDKIWSAWYKPIRNDRYIVIRQARICSYARRVVKELSRQLNCKVVSVDSTNWMLWGVAEQHAYTPFEFISLIKNALCVVTTSYHAIAFSIICNTPFYSLCLNDGQDGRAEYLLKTLGLSNRIVERDDKIEFEPIDYSNVNLKMEKYRTKSQSFLKGSLLGN